MAVTIKDVAKETNLAISTISKYINGGNIREKNRKIIEEAIAKLNYRPNSLARGLRQAKTYTVGLIVESVNTQYNAQLSSYIESTFRNLGYMIVLCCHQNNPKVLGETIEFLVEKKVDGIILSPIKDSPECIGKAINYDIPIVIIDQSVKQYELDYVFSDRVGAAYDAVEYFVNNGHRDIAIITGPMEYQSSIESLRGYKRVLEDYEIDVNEDFVITCDYKSRLVFQNMLQLWNNKKKPTALLISNYNMCMGIMMAVHNLNICIPNELSLITFDDMELSVVVRPKLTSIRQSIGELAKTVCDIMIQRMEGDYSDFPKKIRMKTTLIKRDSVRSYTV